MQQQTYVEAVKLGSPHVVSYSGPLSPVSTTRVDGPLTQAVNLGSGNRALVAQTMK